MINRKFYLVKGVLFCFVGFLTPVLLRGHPIWMTVQLIVLFWFGLSFLVHFARTSAEEPK